jgi:hypothetical protein
MEIPWYAYAGQSRPGSGKDRELLPPLQQRPGRHPDRVCTRHAATPGCATEKKTHHIRFLPWPADLLLQKLRCRVVRAESPRSADNRAIKPRIIPVAGTRSFLIRSFSLGYDYFSTGTPFTQFLIQFGLYRVSENEKTDGRTLIGKIYRDFL